MRLPWQEHGAGAGERRQEHALAAEEPGPEPLLEGDTDLRPQGRAEKRILLAGQAATDLRQIEGEDLARVGGGEGNAPLAGGLVGEVGEEQGNRILLSFEKAVYGLQA